MVHSWLSHYNCEESEAMIGNFQMWEEGAEPVVWSYSKVKSHRDDPCMPCFTVYAVLSLTWYSWTVAAKEGAVVSHLWLPKVPSVLGMHWKSNLCSHLSLKENHLFLLLKKWSNYLVKSTYYIPGTIMVINKIGCLPYRSSNVAEDTKPTQDSPMPEEKELSMWQKLREGTLQPC